MCIYIYHSSPILTYANYWSLLQTPPHIHFREDPVVNSALPYFRNSINYPYPKIH